MKFDNNVINNLLKKRSADDLIATSKKSELKKTLNVFDLIVIGMGAVVGTGIFTIIGSAIQGGPEGLGAGPAIIVSMVLAAIACVFSALCYSEIAAMIPVAGSAYTYTYATMGEFMAWMVGWVLMLEYAIGNITVASAWTGYLVQFLKGFKHLMPDFILNFPMWLRNDYRYMFAFCDKYGLDPHTQMPYLFDKIPIAINLPAIFIVLVLTMLLIRGVKESTRVASIMVGINMFMILSFICVGAFYVKPENWTPFAPNGAEGVFAGAFLIFFAYIGFDALATAAEECKNPQKDLPVGIIGSLIITTIVYVLVALILTGMQDTAAPVPADFLKAPMAYCMTLAHQNWAAGLISIGSLAGLTSVLLVLEMAATRILYAMSRDHFISKRFQKLHPKFHTPALLTWTVGLLAVVGILTLNLDVAAELCNYGTFTSFIIVCVAVLILRKTDPDRPRPFKVPFSPVIPSLGIITCGGLMVYKSMQPSGSAILFPVWLGVGAMIYLLYGFVKNRLNENKIHNEKVAIKKQELYK